MSIYVEKTPNDGPPIREVWAFVTRDTAGRENVIASILGILGSTPLITGNARTFEIFKRLAVEVRTELAGTDQTVHLLHFSNREEIEKW
jgi:hypothetical protein